MKFEHGNDRTRVDRNIAVIDGPVLPMAYSSTGKTFRVERIRIDYTLADDGHWDAGWSIEIGGTALKGDGTDSKNDHSRPVYRQDIKKEPEKWDWLVDLVEKARPCGTPTLPTVED